MMKNINLSTINVKKWFKTHFSCSVDVRFRNNGLTLTNISCCLKQLVNFFFHIQLLKLSNYTRIAPIADNLTLQITNLKLNIKNYPKWFLKYRYPFFARIMRQTMHVYFENTTLLNRPKPPNNQCSFLLPTIMLKRWTVREFTRSVLVLRLSWK